MVRDGLPQDPAGDEPVPTSPTNERVPALAATGDVTRILSQMEQGDGHAAEQLLPLVYEELRQLAARKMAREKPGLTLQPTALVHEAYLRLAGENRPEPWRGRRQFFAAASEAMRRILVESARCKTSLKRNGGEWIEVELGQIEANRPPEEVLALHEAVDQPRAQVSTANK